MHRQRCLSDRLQRACRAGLRVHGDSCMADEALQGAPLGRFASCPPSIATLGLCFPTVSTQARGDRFPARLADMRHPSDTDLVARAMRGDEDASSALFERHTPRAWRAARRVCRDDGLADEALQEGSIRALRFLAAFDEKRSFGSWFTVIVMNCARTLIHIEQARTDVPLEDDHLASHSGRDTSPGDRLALIDALGDLPTEQREVFFLRQVAGCSTAETAQVAGISEGTVKSRLSRAHQRLSAALGGSHANR